MFVPGSLPPMLGTIRRKVPWLMVFEAARMAHGHLMEVTSPQDRAAVAAMVRRTKGRPQALTEREKGELKRIGGQLDLFRFVRSAGPRMVLGRGPKKRR